MNLASIEPSADATDSSRSDVVKLHCTFCRKRLHEVRKLIAGPNVNICDECVILSSAILAEQQAAGRPRYSRRIVAEFVGTALLLAAVVGSGMMTQRLGSSDPTLALLANAVATGGALFVLIMMFGPVSGAHFNPVVTLVMALRREVDAKTAVMFALSQVCGAFVGVLLAHVMFEHSAIAQPASRGVPLSLLISEAIATFGLVLVILASKSHKKNAASYVACYIVAAYFFTSSTSIANPAAGLARSITDTFAGLPASLATVYIAAQIVGALAAHWIGTWLFVPARHSIGKI